MEKVVLGHLLEEVNFKGHWIHRLSDRGGGGGGGGGGGTGGGLVDTEECHMHRMGTCIL